MLMSYEALHASEESTRDRTLLEYGKAADCAGDCIDSLLRMSYFSGPNPGAETDDGFFHNWAYERYVEVPYTLRAVLLLWLRGFYAQAMVLLRHVLEVLVQLRYFRRERVALRRHWLSQTLNGRVKFKTMFESLAPGYYQPHYARILSGFAHAGPAAGAFRFDYQPASGKQLAVSTASLGCQFLPTGAAYVINHTLVLSHGFLKWFPDFFPGYSGLVDSETEGRRKALLAQLENLTRQSPDASKRAKEADGLFKRLILGAA